MSKLKLIVLERAVSELEDACLYYNKQLTGLGFEFEEEVFNLMVLIQENPMLFPVKFSHIREAVVRRFPFVINYEITEKQIIVSAIFHTRQNPLRKIKRKQK